jgi:hypothetical protein
MMVSRFPLSFQSCRHASFLIDTASFVRSSLDVRLLQAGKPDLTHAHPVDCCENMHHYVTDGNTWTVDCQIKGTARFWEDMS